MLFLLLVYMGQPAATAVFGDLSGVVDLSFYQDQPMPTPISSTSQSRPEPKSAKGCR